MSHFAGKALFKLIVSLLLLTNITVSLVLASDSPIQITAIEITVKDVYGNKDLHWLQEFANKYHINSKQSVILALLPMSKGDWVTPQQLLEAERLLRNKRYLRDAQLFLSEDGILQVIVIDNWTLFPTFDINRTGGQNSSAIGIRDSNLLGLGVAATLNYKRDEQKSGYRLRLTVPVGRTNHSFTRIVWEDYDTGTEKAVSYVKPFYTSETENMWLVAASSSDLESTYYQNDQDLGVVTASNTRLRLNYGWLNHYQNDTAYRTLFGWSYDSTDLLEADPTLMVNLFNVSRKSYLWWGKQQFESQFKVLKNIFIIDNKEDINLGLNANYLIGAGKVEFFDFDSSQNLINLVNIAKDKANMLKLFSSFSIGNQIESTLLLHRANFNAEIYDNGKIQNYYSANYRINLFYPFNHQWSFYNGNNLSYVSQFRQVPIAVGGDSGLRGYPVSYQWGNKRFLSNFELRYYTDTILWDTFSIGWVAFVDIGRAWQSEGFDNLEDRTLKSVGVGIRIFPKVASGRNVVHVDLARPYSNNAEINDWEWRVQVKNSF